MHRPDRSFLAYRANAVINEVVAKTKKQDALYDFVAEDMEEEEEQRRNRREVYYGKDANARSQRSRRRHIYLFNPEDMDNADIISMVENSPTYLRDKSTLNSIKMKAEQEGQLATEAAQEAEGGAGGVITF